MENLEVGYGDVQVLWGVSLEIRIGETVALVGANGAGKTTLIRSVCGLLTPYRGRIAFDGRDILRVDTSSRVSMGIIHVPEGRRLFFGMTVEENILMGAYSRRRQKDYQSRIIKENLDFIYDLFPEISQRRKQLAGTLSGGEQQMVAIGRALMGSPKFLLVDEFSLGLAPVAVDRLYQALDAIRAHSAIGVLLVEQDVHRALSFSNRGLVLETGRIALAGDAKDLLANASVRDAYLGL